MGHAVMPTIPAVSGDFQNPMKADAEAQEAGEGSRDTCHPNFE